MPQQGLRRSAPPATPGHTVSAAKLKLKPGMGDEYKKRHDDIWPELADAIRKAGIRDYSIFLDEETGELVQVTDNSGQRKHIASQEAIASGTSSAAPAAAKTLGAKYAIGVGVLLLLLYAFAWLRRKRAHRGSE